MSVVFPPEQMVVLGEIVAVKDEFTVTITVSFAGPQGETTVTTYVVVETGVATGFEMFGLLRPVVGVHAYPVPPEAFSVVLPALQMVASGPADTTGEEVAVTITG